MCIWWINKYYYWTCFLRAHEKKSPCITLLDTNKTKMFQSCFMHIWKNIFLPKNCYYLIVFSVSWCVPLCKQEKQSSHFRIFAGNEFFILTSSLALKPWKTEIRVVFLTLILVKTAFKLIAYFSTNCFISFSIWLNHSLFALFCLFN